MKNVIKNREITVLLVSNGEANLMDARRDKALSLESERQKNAVRLKEKDDAIFWMSGGYSVDGRRV